MITRKGHRITFTNLKQKRINELITANDGKVLSTSDTIEILQNLDLVDSNGKAKKEPKKEKQTK